MDVGKRPLTNPQKKKSQRVSRIFRAGGPRVHRTVGGGLSSGSALHQEDEGGVIAFQGGNRGEKNTPLEPYEYRGGVGHYEKT